MICTYGAFRPLHFYFATAASDQTLLLLKRVRSLTIEAPLQTVQSPQQEYDYRSRKTVIALASNLETGIALNVVGHLSISLGAYGDTGTHGAKVASGRFRH